MFALGLLWSVFKSFDFAVIFNALPSLIDSPSMINIFGYEISLISLLAFGIFIAAMAKSAQIFLHTGCQMQWKDPRLFLLFAFRDHGYCWGLFDNPLLLHLYLYSELIAGMAYLGILTALVSGLMELICMMLNVLLLFQHVAVRVYGFCLWIRIF